MSYMHIHKLFTMNVHQIESNNKALLFSLDQLFYYMLIMTLTL